MIMIKKKKGKIERLIEKRAIDKKYPPGELKHICIKCLKNRVFKMPKQKAICGECNVL